MRSLLPIALLTSLLALAAPVHAAPADEPLQVLEDGTGDVVVPGMPATALRSYDLRSLKVTDDEDTVTFRIGVDAFASAPNAEFRGQISVTFRHGEVRYILYLTEVNEAGNFFTSTLYRWSEVTQSNQWVANGGSGLEPQGDEMVLTYNKLDLADEHGAPPFQGRSLEDLAVQSRLYLYGPWQALDHMPDQGEGADYALRGGLEQHGIALWSLAPFRTSNGEATTFVYTVKVENLGPATEVELASDLAPAGWSIDFPTPRLLVPERATLDVPVLATVPFAHEHGSAPSFLVTARSEDGGLGQLRLGVHYPATPFLSGHHSEVFLHTGLDGGVDADARQVVASWDANGWGWMTPMEDDPADEGAHFIGRPYQDGTTGTSFFWYASGRDQPIGLDFDLERPVTVRMPVKLETPLDGAQMTALFYAGWPTGDGAFETIFIAEMASEVRDIGPGVSEFVMEALPMPDADRIEVRKDMYTGWNFWLNGERPTLPAGLANGVPFSASLLPGGRASIPLVEFHDAVEDIYATTDGLLLEAAGPETTLVNPGETVVADVTLVSPEAGEVHVALRGAHAEWARVLGANTLDVAAGAEETLRIAVTVPADAGAQQLDLLVEAHGPGGATALLRMGGAVVTDVDVPDEAALAGAGSKDAPAPGLGLGLAVLVALALVVRRRAGGF